MSKFFGINLERLFRSIGWSCMAIMMVMSIHKDNGRVMADSKRGAEGEGERGATIGIDLGTTYSCVAVWKNNQIDIAPNDQGGRTTPSWVAYTEEGGLLVGDAAKNQVSMNPENTVYDAKRILGRKYSESTVQQDIKNWPFKIVNEGDKPKISVKINGQQKIKAPEEISAQVLDYLKKCAENYLGEKVTHAVITVPAYFNDAQRQATKDAGVVAGLVVDRILNEPTAAALAYGIDKQGAAEQKILVYDLGGGTFDVSLLAFSDGIFEVKAVSGDTHLGGQDFDQRVVDELVKEIKKTREVDLTGNKKAISKLRAETEKAKRVLSTATRTQIIIDSLLPEGTKGGRDFTFDLTRARFEEINRSLFENTLPPIDTALKAAHWSDKDVNKVLLVGGSTRIPRIRELLTKRFGEARIDYSVHPDEAVAYGAAVQAGVLTGKAKSKDILVLDVTPLSLGIETQGGVMSVIVPRNTMIPVKKSLTYTTAADNQTEVDIKIYEGERPLVKDNHFLGSFHLSGIPLAPRGVPQIEITLEVDANSIATVTAVEKATGKSGKINITDTKHKLSKEEIQRMVDDAEKFRGQDEALKEKLEARTGLDNYLYSIKSQLSDEKGVGAKIDAEEKAKVLSLVEEKTKWMEANKESASKEDFEEQKHEVEKVFGPIITKLYQQEGQGGDTGASQAADDGKAGGHDEL